MWEQKLNFAGLEKQYGLPPGALRAVMQAESAGNPKAVSPKGAKGLFQFMPATAQEYGIDPFNPEQAAPAAAKMLGSLQRQFGSFDKALAGYNWGSGNLQKHGLQNAPEETRNYIQKITSSLGSENISIDGPNYSGSFALMDDLTPAEQVELRQLEAEFGDVSNDLTPEEQAELASLEEEFASTGFKQYNPIQAASIGIAQGVTGNLFDEALAGIQSVPSIFDGQEGSTYEANLKRNRNVLKQAQEERPVSYAAGTIGGSIAPVAAAGKLAGGTKLASDAMRFARNSPGMAAATAGALQGGLYGFGGGEGSAGQRLGEAGLGAGVGTAAGGALGLVGSRIGNAVAQRQANKTLSVLDKQAAAKAGIDIKDKAMEKIVSRLKGDFPNDADFKQALIEFSKSGTLAEMGPRTQNLLKGAVQYPSGRAVAEEFFYGKPETPGGPRVGGAVDSAMDDLSASVGKDVRGGKEYFDELEGILSKGQKKAAPLYDKAYKANPYLNSPKLDAFLSTETGNAALKKAAKLMEDEGVGFPGDESGISLQTYDYMKRSLDDMYSSAKRAGNRQEARALNLARKNLLEELDALDVSGAYKQARKTSADYLTVEEALTSGRDFQKLQPVELGKKLNGLSEPEKEAFRLGVGQKLDETINAGLKAGSVVNKVFGSKAARERLKSVLTPQQYNSFQAKARAVDQLVALKQNTIGGSATMSNAKAAEEFSEEIAEIMSNAATGGVSGAVKTALANRITKFRAGLSDKSAEAVAKALLEKDPRKKLALARTIANQTGAITTKEKKMALQVFFNLQDAIKSKSALPVGAASGAVGSDISRPFLQLNTGETVYYE